MSETRMEQKIDLDALEAALAGLVTDEKAGRKMSALRGCVELLSTLPALIAELRQLRTEADELRARTTPEPISDRHKDGNWRLLWEPDYEQWFKARWYIGSWQMSGAWHFEGTPTHALPMPEEVKP